MKLNLILLLSILSIRGMAQMPGVVMQVDIDNWVTYNYDSFDRTTWARSPGPAAAAPGPPAFGSGLLLADIVAVNSKPAKGLVLLRLRGLNLRPAPTPGQAISDVNRSGVGDFVYEFLADDGTPIGSIMASGLFGGAAPPGGAVELPGPRRQHHWRNGSLSGDARTSVDDSAPAECAEPSLSFCFRRPSQSSLSRRWWNLSFVVPSGTDGSARDRVGVTFGLYAGQRIQSRPAQRNIDPVGEWPRAHPSRSRSRAAVSR